MHAARKLGWPLAGSVFSSSRDEGLLRELDDSFQRGGWGLMWVVQEGEGEVTFLAPLQF